MPTVHPRFSHFFAVLAAPAWLVPWEGRVIRQSDPKWMSRPYRLTGLGSALGGARWNTQGLVPTVYASTTPDTLQAEAYHRGRRFGWTDDDFAPQLIVGMRWKLQAVVDLTAPAMLDALQVTTAQIVDCDWKTEQTDGREALTQAIGRAAFENRAEGLIVPSARHPGGINLVYFPNHQRDGSTIETLKEASIPFTHGL